METQKNKRTKKEIEEDELEFSFEKHTSQISVGDIVIISKGGLPVIQKTITKLLNDREVKKYLDFYSKRKAMGSLSYIG